MKEIKINKWDASLHASNNFPTNDDYSVALSLPLEFIYSYSYSYASNNLF